MATIDYYAESNTDDFVDIGDYGIYVSGQVFYVATDHTLTSASFYIKRYGTLSGSVYVRIYAITGTPGTTAVPTGSVLATSNAVDASVLPTSYTLKEFVFSGANQISLLGDTWYAVVIYYPETGGGNSLHAGVDTSAHSHAGNFIDDDGSQATSWAARTNFDLCFYVYGNLPYTFGEPIDFISIVDVPTIEVSSPSAVIVDTASISEFVGLQKISVIALNIVDSITITDSVVIRRTLNRLVFDSCSISENFSVSFVYYGGTDAVNNPKTPVYSLAAAAGLRAGLDVKSPVVSCVGFGGAEVAENSFSFYTAGSVSFSLAGNLSKKTPVFSVETSCGGELVATGATVDCEIESYSNFAGVNYYTPIYSFVGSAYEESSLSLSVKTPFPFISASGYGEFVGLDTKGPAVYMSIGESYRETGANLDCKSPAVKVVYGSMLVGILTGNLDQEVPIWTMTEDTGEGDTDLAEARYSERFSNYTLEFIR